ncbi:MAG: hypothetical protein NQ127_02445, partial [Candidatus Cardinium sp.]|nr:hypothetical protein [Candidatus Cardinium sp.]
LLEEEKQFENSSEESDLNSNIDRYTQGIVQQAIEKLKENFQSACPQFNFEDCMRIVHECLPGTSGNTVSGLSYLNQLNKLNQYGSDTFYLCPSHQTSVQCKNVGDQCVPFIFGTAPKEECSRKYKQSWCSDSHSIRACNAMIDACADGIHQENLLWVCHALCTSRNNRTIVSDLDRNCPISQGYSNQAIDQWGGRAIRLNRRGRDAERKDQQQNKYRKNQPTQGKSYRGNLFFRRK